MKPSYTIKEIPIEELYVDYSWQQHVSKASVETLKESIAQVGLLIPLIIRDNGEILNGKHRYQALLELGEKHVSCIIVDMTVEEYNKSFDSETHNFYR